MTDTISGHTWVVQGVDRWKNGSRKGDGDTLRLWRNTIQLLGDRRKYVEDLDWLPCRLAWVDTPERGTPGYGDAVADLSWWVDFHTAEGHELDVVCFGTAGWDRELVDLICVEDGDSASQWLMTEGNNGAGWPAYVKE